jgi:CheY-specific phosphatase CheX
MFTRKEDRQACPADLKRIIEDLFSTMLHLQALEVNRPYEIEAGRLTAIVYMTGSWTGAFLFECGAADACRLAGWFLSIDPPMVVDSLVRDVLGEIANIIGGNAKCALTTSTVLSPPTVIDGHQFSVRICGEQYRDQFSYVCDVGRFWVSVVTTSADPIG